LRWAHGHDAVLIDFDDVSTGIAAALDPAEHSLRRLDDDRVCVGVSFDHEALRRLSFRKVSSAFFRVPSGSMSPAIPCFLARCGILGE
jgi:hypothetical protein